jgi:uncharacterized protein (TIGR00730 family)
MATVNSICVYCGSSDSVHADYLEAASNLGAVIAGRGLRIIYGAGCTGLMGALADGALQAGGEVIGVIPRRFNTPTSAHRGLTELEVVDTIHQRKARMIEKADAFIALPGGFGTLEELFEVLTWAQIGFHCKPVGLLNIRDYFAPLLKLIKLAQLEGFIYDEHRVLLTCHEYPDNLLETLTTYQRPAELERWLTCTE